MTNKIMWRGIGALLLMLLLLSSNVCAQTDTLLYPLKNVPLLSGNFGELRATHLHTGLDFKTGGREGLPVICVKDGVVARKGFCHGVRECPVSGTRGGNNHGVWSFEPFCTPNYENREKYTI